MIEVGIKLYENIYPHVRIDVNTAQDQMYERFNVNVCKVSTEWMDGWILTLYLSTDYAQICPLWEKYVLDKLDVFERHQRFIFSW